MIRPKRASSAALRAATLTLAALLVASAGTVASHADEKDLPPGPIHDRHELMEGVGDDAKAIGAATKTGKPADAVKPAEAIAAALEKFPGMFPAGSESPLSRAKPEIWTDKAKFDEKAKQGREAALALAATAKEGGDLKAASGKMFKTCKGCHESFRKPEEEEE
jgi:cytochrome c556